MADVKPDIHAIFNEAIELESDEQRLKYLDEACGGDPMVRETVEALLRADAEAGNFLGGQNAGSDASSDQSAFDSVGALIGPYQVREQIGEGGMGVVYVAEQTAPVRRQVAVKIIKPGMDSGQVLARFEAERQALAMMEHPNIAKVFDGGMTDTGRPYFAMELVKGVPITQYCDACQLGIRPRLELFVTVCLAVQHAHQKGIIHRDLKPSNILVAIQDGHPAPKIIDFGIAKAMNQRLSEQTLRTAFAQMIGTPMYMSPEQAELSRLDVDTRSDIYSLGVLMYELLTGATPFASERFSEASFDELRRIIREEDPPRPSTRVSTLAADASTTLVETRHSDARHLTRQLRGELDCITMKALAKDRTRRYAAANDLAADIDRYLRHEPVLARPASTLYRFSKFTRRNRTLVASLAAVLVALSMGFALATAGYVTAQRRLAEARHEQEGNRILIDMLRDVYGIPFGMETHGQESTVSESLESVSVGLDERLRDHPKVAIEIHQIVANTYMRYAKPAKAREHLQQALKLAELQYGLRHEKVADVLTDLADEVQWQAEETSFDRAESQEFAERALDIYDEIGVESQQTAHALYLMASSLRVEPARHNEAEEYLRRAWRITEDLALGNDTKPRLFAMWDLAFHIAAREDGRDDEANSLIQQALEMSRRISGDRSSLTASVIAVQGDCFRHQGNFSRALTCYLASWEIFKQAGLQTERKGHLIALTLAETYHVAHRHLEANEVLDEIEEICHAHAMLDTLARCFYLRGWGHLLREDYAAAETSLREAVRLAEEHLGQTHEITAYARFNLARSFEAQGQFNEARDEYQKILPLTKQLVQAKQVSEQVLYGHAWALLHGGDERHPQVALEAAERGLAKARVWPQSGSEPHLRLAVAIAQHELGRTEQAVASLRTGLDKIKLPSMRPDRKNVPKSRRELEVTLARYLVELGDDEGAEQVYRDGIDARLKVEHLDSGHLQVALAELHFGTFLREQRQFERAKEQLISAQQKLRGNSEAADANRAQVATQLVALYTTLEKPEEASRWQAEVDEVNQRISASANAASNRAQERDSVDKKQN